MEFEGPVLETLTRRLAETPEDFLAEPRIGAAGRVHTAAVVGDLLRALGSVAPGAELRRFAGADARTDRNRLSITLVLCWLLADEWFARASLPPLTVLEVLDVESRELAGQSPAAKFITDPDRREELARLALARLGYRPAGETQAQAQDRLTTLSSAERARVMRAARAAEQRAREIREALMRKAADEAADKWGRE
ncbi:MAG TPA: hypothetical protein VFS20_02900 [Longimicrobium sp.]|nr:hypothetical protein [Longimicrobium sp.]